MKEDWDSWGGKLTDGGHHAYLICGVGVDAIRGMCASDHKGDVKTAITNQVKTFACHGGAGDDATMKLNGTQVDFTGDLAQKHGVKPSPKEILMQSLH
jgi:hypothetical protein